MEPDVVVTAVAAGRVFEWGWAAAAGLLTVVGILVGIIRHHDVRRLDEMKDQIKDVNDNLEASLAETNKQMAKLDERQDKFGEMFHQLRLSANTIEGQVGRIASDMESEKRPRADTNAMIIRQLEALNREMTKRNKGRSSDGC